MTQKVANSELDWETESSDSLYKFENQGEKLVGLLIDKKMVKGDYNPYMVATILTKTGEVPFACTGSLTDELKKPQYVINATIIEVELTELKDTGKKQPFKKFKVRSARSTDARLAALGIQQFDMTAETSDEETL